MTREEAIRRFENVKANALVQKASGVSEYWQNEIDGTVEAIDMAIEALKAEPIRCKDCRHYIVEGITTRYGWCHEYKHSVDEDDYCSYGERKGGGDE